MGYLFERVVTTKFLEEFFDVKFAKKLVKRLAVVHMVFRKFVNQFKVEFCLELVLRHLRHTGFFRIARLLFVRVSVFRKPVDEGMTWRWINKFLGKVWTVLIADVSKVETSKLP